MVIQPFFLGEAEVHAAEDLIVAEAVLIPDAALAVAVFAAVRTEPDRLAVLHLSDRERFQVFDRKVQVADAAADHVAQVLDGVDFSVGLVCGRRVDDADVIVEVDADVLFIEFQRGQAVVRVEFLVLVAVFEVELLHRLAEADAEGFEVC